jgi:hypothetical protein
MDGIKYSKAIHKYTKAIAVLKVDILLNACPMLFGSFSRRTGKKRKTREITPSKKQPIKPIIPGKQPSDPTHTGSTYLNQ